MTTPLPRLASHPTTFCSACVGWTLLDALRTARTLRVVPLTRMACAGGFRQAAPLAAHAAFGAAFGEYEHTSVYPHQVSYDAAFASASTSFASHPMPSTGDGGWYAPDAYQPPAHPYVAGAMMAPPEVHTGEVHALRAELCDVLRGVEVEMEARVAERVEAAAHAAQLQAQLHDATAKLRTQLKGHGGGGKGGVGKADKALEAKVRAAVKAEAAEVERAELDELEALLQVKPPPEGLSVAPAWSSTSDCDEKQHNFALSFM